MGRRSRLRWSSSPGPRPPRRSCRPSAGSGSRPTSIPGTCGWRRPCPGRPPGSCCAARWSRPRAWRRERPAPGPPGGGHGGRRRGGGPGSAGGGRRARAAAPVPAGPRRHPLRRRARPPAAPAGTPGGRPGRGTRPRRRRQVAPSTNPLASPVFWKALVDSGGGNLIRGARHLAADLATPPRVPTMVAADAFEVGADLALTPGAVVLRTPVFELLQYQPQTPRVRRVPLLIVPPMINKYYILDLAPGRSLIEHLVGSGQQVFVISWNKTSRRARDPPPWNTLSGNPTPPRSPAGPRRAFARLPIDTPPTRPD